MPRTKQSNYDWFEPFPRDAILILHPDTGSIVLQRPMDQYATDMGDTHYHMVEAVRRDWVDVELGVIEAKNNALKEEENKIRDLIHAREIRSRTAEEIFELLKSWKPWADMKRWDQLKEWLEEHPQRDLEEDWQFDNLEQKLAYFLPDPVILEPKKGRGQGRRSPMSEESKQKKSEAMKLLWKKRHATGSVPKGLGRPKAVQKETPY